MVKRVYVDNYRCLVNFELRLNRVSLLLGPNGTGKTALFEALRGLQELVAGNAKVLAAFPSADLTSWQTSPMQRFELELQVGPAPGLQLGPATYGYSLVVEHDAERRKAKVQSETLTVDGKKLFHFQEGTAELYHDDFTPGPQYPFDWTQSGVGVLQPRHDNKKLTRFRKEMQSMIIVGLQPALMTSESREEAASLSRDMENFVSWFRYLSQEHTGAMSAIFAELKRVLPGFSACNLKEAGEARVMKVLFDRPDGSGRPIAYDFKALSHGQRILIALYSLLFGLKDEGVSLFLDEPDNFVALGEIQPWLTELTDLAGDGIEQAVLISHHPEIINYLAASSGRWFERESNVPARVSDKPKATVEGLTPAETIARGWEK
ncbi:MAG: AAA family ATPase [Limisphaerales bacterium]